MRYRIGLADPPHERLLAGAADREEVALLTRLRGVAGQRAVLAVPLDEGDQVVQHAPQYHRLDLSTFRELCLDARAPTISDRSPCLPEALGRNRGPTTRLRWHLPCVVLVREHAMDDDDRPEILNEAQTWAAAARAKTEEAREKEREAMARNVAWVEVLHQALREQGDHERRVA